jgi:hypothetical protein
MTRALARHPDIESIPGRKAMSRLTGFILVAWAPLAARYALVDGSNRPAARARGSSVILRA